MTTSTQITSLILTVVV